MRKRDIFFDRSACYKACKDEINDADASFEFDLKHYFLEAEIDLVCFVVEDIEHSMLRSEAFRQHAENGIKVDFLIAELVENYKYIFEEYAEGELEEGFRKDFDANDDKRDWDNISEATTKLEYLNENVLEEKITDAVYELLGTKEETEITKDLLETQLAFYKLSV